MLTFIMFYSGIHHELLKLSEIALRKDFYHEPQTYPKNVI